VSAFTGGDRIETRQNQEASEPSLSAAGVSDAPLATAAALDSTTFAGQ